MKVIVHVDNSKIVTGAYVSLRTLCEETPDYQHVWVLPRGSAVMTEVRERYVVYELPFVELSRSPTHILTYLPALLWNGLRLRTIIKRESASILHMNDLYNLTGYVARLGLRVPLLVHARMLQHSFPAFIYRFWVRWHLSCATCVVAVSKAVKRHWKDDPRVRVVYDVANLNERYPMYRFHRPLEGEPFRFVFLANYVPGKGQDQALQAIAIAAEQCSTPFEVDFVGEAATEKSRRYLEVLKEQAERTGITARVRFFGRTSDVEKTLKQYHAVLHFSRTESFGLVCFEACFYGLPVISTACGGPEEIIEDGVSGILVPVGDAIASAQAMAWLVDDPSLCERLSETARNQTRRKLGPEQLNIGRVVEELKCPVLI